MTLTKIRLHLSLNPAQAATGLRMVLAGQTMWRLGVMLRQRDVEAGDFDSACARDHAALVAEAGDIKRCRPWLADIPDRSLVLVLKAVQKAFKDHRDHGRGLPSPMLNDPMCFFPSVEGVRVDLAAGKGELPFLGSVLFTTTWACRDTTPAGALWRAKIHHSKEGWFLTLIFREAGAAGFQEVA